ncbi:MAG: tRNA (adenosine(37)-N6)-threonylcarbamoyltransferase complex dimerization subunit type 1 TsaB, partial [Firmicutes bacterium]|nr:tRNA (adenosine(37)-N6)-threonylcarbamoyltransferase complex dimerization subunit type 1 TsaB [Bacillota bacterium]
MKCLAINTASCILQVAAINGDKVAVRTNLTQKNFTSTLLPYVDECLIESGISLKDVDFFVSSIGPGSFTGIRVGLATVRGFSQALGKKIIPVTDLELLSYHAKSDKRRKVCVSDASNGFFYIGQFSNEQIGEIECINAEKMESFLQGIDDEFVVCFHKSIEGKVMTFAKNVQNIAQIYVVGDECDALVNIAKDKNALSRLIHYSL